MASLKVVLANGCFDPFHIGHLYHLQAARRYGTHLFVSITKDAYVRKGPGRPVFPANERRDMIESLRCVDQTLLVADAMEALEMVQPDVFVKGADYIGKIEPEHYEYCKRHDIKIVFTHQKTYSSTELLRHYDRARQG